MPKEAKITSRLLIIAALLSGIALLLMPGCEPKDNPKLSPDLNGLVQAEWRGEAEEFAHRNCIELLDGDSGLVSVEVEIDCAPGQVDAAIKAAETYGTVESNYLYMILAVVPVNKLTALAKDKSIELVRIPEYAEGA
jgi:hypothetical protein